MAKTKKISDEEKKAFKEKARVVIRSATPRPVPGNKEGRASEFYKGSRPNDFLMDLFPVLPGATVFRAQKKRVPPKARGAR